MCVRSLSRLGFFFGLEETQPIVVVWFVRSFCAVIELIGKSPRIRVQSFESEDKSNKSGLLICNVYRFIFAVADLI